MGTNRTQIEVTRESAYGKDILDCWDPEFARMRCMEHGPGWIGLVTELHFRLRFLVGDYSLYQIKEKFGTLRYYSTAPSVALNTGSDELTDTVQRLISDAEHRSETICEVCGHAGTLTQSSTRWWRTRCGSCKDREDAKAEAQSSGT